MMAAPAGVASFSTSVGVEAAVGDASARAGADAAVAGERVEAARDEVDAWTPDPTRPVLDPWATARLLTPLAEATVSGALLLEGVASARKGFALQGVSLWIDDHRVARLSGEAWSYELDTTRLLDGRHELTLVAFATLAVAGDASVAPRAGWGETIVFHTLNGVPSRVIHAFEADVSGAASDVFTMRIDEPLVGLRVTFEATPAEDGSVPLRGQSLVAYKETPEEGDEAATETWAAQYGLIRGAAMIMRAPADQLEAPGVLSMTTAFVGEGRGKVTIEALLAPHNGAAEG